MPEEARIDEAQVRKTVMAIVQNGDLNELTEKLIRRQAEKKLFLQEKSLDSQKELIKRIVTDFLSKDANTASSQNRNSANSTSKCKDNAKPTPTKPNASPSASSHKLIDATTLSKETHDGGSTTDTGRKQDNRPVREPLKSNWIEIKHDAKEASSDSDYEPQIKDPQPSSITDAITDIKKSNDPHDTVKQKMSTEDVCSGTGDSRSGKSKLKSRASIAKGDTKSDFKSAEIIENSDDEGAMNEKTDTSPKNSVSSNAPSPNDLSASPVRSTTGNGTTSNPTSKPDSKTASNKQKERRISSTKSKLDDPNISEKEQVKIENLKKYVIACGFKKRWAKEFEGLTGKERVGRLEEMLKDMGVVGRATMEQCKKVKARREYEEEQKSLNPECILPDSAKKERRRQKSMGLWKPAPSAPQNECSHLGGSKDSDVIILDGSTDTNEHLIMEVNERSSMMKRDISHISNYDDSYSNKDDKKPVKRRRVIVVDSDDN
ncbi:hypothetical protein SeMB42_g05814 [Synchytrium endobioticum]|uniref:DEK-C domain-containing protein n=1 Tax=Synchytrium endobioticum TaxID=286115 RepID=A0A507CMZ0_9FUNG|nr:hypothetical protein SeLEV6574_g06581 [Synchytrium endobioticum]TPX40902.1 hypothetical protein SeMB42_g05814 [Synchytrium endobioticum]